MTLETPMTKDITIRLHKLLPEDADGAESWLDVQLLGIFVANIPYYMSCEKRGVDIVCDDLFVDLLFGSVASYVGEPSATVADTVAAEGVFLACPVEPRCVGVRTRT